MPKSKKGSSRDLLDKVKKISAAGRGGDTKLAHLSPLAQKILKSAGGAGTRNPKTGLKEFKAAAEMGRRAIAELEEEGEARRSLAEFEAAQMQPPIEEPAMERAAVQPEAEPVIAAPPPVVEPPPAAAPGSAAADLQQITNPTAPPPAAAAPPPAASAPGSAAVDMAELDRIAQGFRDAGMGNTGVDVSGLAPGSLTTPTGQVNAQLFDPNLDMSGISNVDPSTLSPGQQGTPPPPGSAAADLQQITNPAALPTAAPPVEQPPLFDDDMTPAQRRAAARRDEDLFRPPQTTPGRDMPSQPPPSQPPPSQPPVTQPPPTQPPPTQPPPPPPPPPSQPPPTQPPPAQPPITQPPGPVTQPPVTQPPVTQPPVTQPPVTQPPVATPPGLIDSPLPKPPAQPPAQPPGTGGIKPLPPGTLPPSAKPPVPPDVIPPGADPSIRTGDFIDRNLNGINDREEPPDDDGMARTGDFQDRNKNGIDDRDEKPSRGGGGFNFGNVFGEDTDIGRLIGRIGRGGGGRGGGKKPPPGDGKIPELPPTGGGLPARPELPPVVRTPQPPDGDAAPPVAGPPVYTPPPPIRMPSTPLPPPLPTPIGAGTPTPYFNPNAGGLTPGTVPAGRTPSSLATSNVPLQALAQNPNLGPTMLGGAENAGYYTDRFGNTILSPGAVKPGGRKTGGPANADELLRLMQEIGGDKANSKALKQFASARSMLDELSSKGPRTELSFDETPISQSVRRTSRRPIREETDRGSARGMAMELEEVTTAKRPRTKRQAEEARQKMELIRETLGMPTFSQASLAREGELMAKRFAEGGDVKKKEDRLLTPYEIMEQLGTGLATGVGRRIEGTAAMVQDPAGAFQALRDQLDKVIKDPENIPGWVKDFVVEKLQRASSGPQGAGEVLAEFLRLPGKDVPKRDIFIGEKSPSFDQEAKTMAKALEERGAPKDEIIDITKTFRSADGSWKQEASDDLLSFDLEGFSKAPRLTEPRPFKERFEDALRSLSPESRRMYGPERTKYAFGQLTSPTQKPIRYEMSDFISHPVLEKAYPGITQGLLERTAPDAGYLGSASGKGLIELNTAIREKMKNPKEFDPRATLVHEFQHLVQQREGSAPGGSSEIWETELPRSLFDVVFRYPRYGYMPPDFIGDVYRKAHSDRFDKNLPKEERKKAAALLKELETTYSPNNLYRALMGEAEARAAQARTYLTPEERAARSPLKDYDVDFEKQLDLREPGAYPSFYYSGRNPFAMDKSKK